MARAINRRKREAEKRFPHRVDVLVPDGGLGEQFNEMLTWCRQHVAASEWDQHHHRARGEDGTPIDYARFYFMNEADAEAFRRQWAESIP